MRLNNLVESLEQDVMSGEVVKCPILHVRPKFDVFTLLCMCLSVCALCLII